MLVSSAGIHNILVRISYREDPDQMKKQFDLGLLCLSRLFLQAAVFKILEHLLFL